MEEQIEAERNLASFSQHTHYISEWREASPRRMRKLQKHREAITEEEHEQVTQKRSIPNREPSERYDLKKWEQRMQSLNNIQYPILEKKDLFTHEESYVLPKTRLKVQYNQSAMLVSRRKNDFSDRLRHLIEDKVKERKREKCKKKEDGIRSPALPKIYKLKRQNRDSSRQEVFQSRPLLPARQLKQLKKSLEKQNRKFSLPNLMQIHQSPRVSASLHHR